MEWENGKNPTLFTENRTGFLGVGGGDGIQLSIWVSCGVMYTPASACSSHSPVVSPSIPKTMTCFVLLDSFSSVD